MDRNETRARKLFRKVRIGHYYEWRGGHWPEEDDLYVVLVESKRLIVGKKNGVEISGDWFWTRDGIPLGQGIPAGTRTWNRCGDVLREWKGERPKRAPIHEKWRCRECREDTGSTGVDPGLSECCDSEQDQHGLYVGAHDESCVCKDCKE